jgi:DNA-binding GntR family transcriptional regulator
VVKKIVPTSLRDQIVQSVQDAIITNELVAGQDIPVDRLAAQYGVSATPVREALAVLEGVGLVKFVPNKGTQVTMICPQDVSDVWEMRRLIEPYAAEIAAVRCTEEEIADSVKMLSGVQESPDDFDRYIASDFHLHELLLEHVDNRLFHETLQRIWRLSMRIRYFAERTVSARADVVVEVTGEHLAITRALERRDGHLASHLVLHHLVNGEARTLEAVRQRINSV